ncbi:MAG: hypothetical protein WD314_03015 [Trueperaceae bacterium]
MKEFVEVTKYFQYLGDAQQAIQGDVTRLFEPAVGGEGNVGSFRQLGLGKPSFDPQFPHAVR